MQKNNGQTLAYKDLELAWLKKWSQFGYKVSNIQFRYFSNYIGSNINIVPEEISHFIKGLKNFVESEK